MREESRTKSHPLWKQAFEQTTAKQLLWCKKDDKEDVAEAEEIIETEDDVVVEVVDEAN